MLKVRKGWYLRNEADNEDEEETMKSEKDLQLKMRQAAMIERCDNKIARRQSQIKRQEILEQKKCLHAREAIDSNRKVIKLTHSLADDELSQETDKVCLQTGQEKSLKPRDKDETFEKLQIKKEKKKQDYRDDLKKKLPDNHRRIQEDRTKEKNQSMIEPQMQKIQEKDMNMRKKKNKNAILIRSELGAALAAKKIWQKTYEKALKDKDERIIHIIAENEAQQKKMIDKRTEIYMAEDAAINRIARKLFDNAYEKKRCKEMCDKFCREEERSKWATEKERISLKKQHTIIDSLKEMGREHKIIAENKAKNAAIDDSFTRYFVIERERNFEKQRKYDEARCARNNRYNKELRETIINKKISRAMNSLERQYKICIYDKSDKTADDECKEIKR